LALKRPGKIPVRRDGTVAGFRQRHAAAGSSV
jgi:hypothetical protein